MDILGVENMCPNKKMKYWVSAQEIGKGGEKQFLAVSIVGVEDDVYTVRLQNGEEFLLISSQIVTLIDFLAMYEGEEYAFSINRKTLTDKTQMELNNIIREKLVDKLIKSQSNVPMLQALLQGASIQPVKISEINTNKEEILLMITDSLPPPPPPSGERTGVRLPERITSLNSSEDYRMGRPPPSDIVESLKNPNSVYEFFNNRGNTPKTQFLKVKIRGLYQGGGPFTFIVENVNNALETFSIFADQLLPLGSFEAEERFSKRDQEKREEEYRKKEASFANGVGRGGGGGPGGAGGGGGS
jgi:hypothetical protein